MNTILTCLTICAQSKLNMRCTVNNKILTIVGMISLVACEVNVSNTTNNESAPIDSKDAAPFSRSFEADPLPTSDPFEAFLMPSSFEPALTKNSENRTMDDDLSLVKIYFRAGGSIGFDRRYHFMNAYIESSDGADIEHASLVTDLISGGRRICASTDSKEMNTMCSMLIRNIQWVNSNTASYELCLQGQTGPLTGYAIEQSCVTKYSNE